MTASMVSLLIPTMNRSDFLIRELKYYRDTGFQGYVCIGDSSNAEHIERTKKAIQTLQGSLNIIYREYPSTNDAEVLKRLLELVTTRYAALVADDDFLVPKAVDECALFLEQHSDYNSAHGKALTITLKSKGAYGQISGIRPYQQAVIDGETAVQRILGHMRDYQATMFGVHSTASWRKMYKNISLIQDKTFAAELLPCCLSVIHGKVKQLDCLYLIRHDHAQRYLLPQKDKWIRDPGWTSDYAIFRNLLAQELVNNDGISQEQAQAVIDKAFDSYMVSLLGSQWQSYRGKTDKGILNSLRRLASMIPGSRRFWGLLHPLKSGKQFESGLTESLNPSSPYYADFLPVYRAVADTHARQRPG